jgi:hypothetical protein
VKIVDADGLETTLRLDKQAKLKIGTSYRFYFAARNTALPLGTYLSDRLDSARLLGFEAVGESDPA